MVVAIRILDQAEVDQQGQHKRAKPATLAHVGRLGSGHKRRVDGDRTYPQAGTQGRRYQINWTAWMPDALAS